MFIALLKFSTPLATKCMSLNNEPCTTRPFLFDLNSVELKHYRFMISLDKHRGSWKSFDLSTIICVLNNTKYIIVKVFGMIANKNEAKTLVRHITFDCKYKFKSKTCNSNQGKMKRSWFESQHIYL